MKQKTVLVSEVTNLRMVAGNEKKYTHIIHNGVVKEWVGFGWIPESGPATPEDYKKYPVVVQKGEQY